MQYFDTKKEVDNFLKSNNNIKKPIFNIGDIVIVDDIDKYINTFIKDLTLFGDYLYNVINKDGDQYKYYKFLFEKNFKFKIIEKYYGYIWWSKIDDSKINYSEIKLYYIPDFLLKKIEPNYNSKKLIYENVKFDEYKKKYDHILIKINSNESENKIRKIYKLFQNYGFNMTEYTLSKIIFNMKKLFNEELIIIVRLNNSEVELDFGWSKYDYTTKNLEFYNYEKIYSINDVFNGKLELLLKYGVETPSYKPKILIKESADYVELPDGRVLHFTDSDAISFVYIYDKLYISKPGQQHLDIISNYIKNSNNINIIEDDIHENKKLNGRLWLNNNVISIWDDISIEDLKQLIFDLKNIYSITINPDEWILEYYKHADSIENQLYLQDYLNGNENNIINSKYIQEEDKELQKKYHIMSPIDKEKYKIDNYKTFKNKPIELKQALLTSENFNSDNNEYYKKYHYLIFFINSENNSTINEDNVNFLFNYLYNNNLILNEEINNSSKRNIISYLNNNNPIYIKLFKLENNFLDFTYGTFSIFNTRSELFKHFYHIDDLKNGIIDNILDINKPNYKPKQLVYESIQKPNYKEIVLQLNSFNDYNIFLEEYNKYFNKIFWDFALSENDFKNQPVYLFYNFNNEYFQWLDSKSNDELNKYLFKSNNVYKPIYELKDINFFLKSVKNNNIVEIRPNYNPKKLIYENINTDEIDYSSIDYFKKYNSLIIKIEHNNNNEINEKNINYVMKYLNNNKLIQFFNYLNIPEIDLYIKHFNRMLNILSIEDLYIRIGSYSWTYTSSVDLLNFNKIYTIEDIKNGVIDKIYGINIKPNYNPKKLVSEQLLLEKSSLTTLGIPTEVMKQIQSDYALLPNIEWKRILRKSDVEKILRTGTQELFIQIAVDAIKVLVLFNGTYFIDRYIYDENLDWSGGYKKIKREILSKNQLMLEVESRTNIYYLVNGNFTIHTKKKREILKKEKEFINFNNHFKEYFLNNFDKLLKSIIDKNFKDAKGENLKKGERIAKENDMFIKGLKNSLESPNSLSILDELIIKFEEAYSEHFNERIDIKEMCDLFGFNKIMTSFMLYLYSGKLIIK
jgi:hypothetical protein